MTKERILKVQEVGDFYAKKTKPSLLLSGKWMIEAGINPNRKVIITNPEPGVLIIKEQP